uniref:Uncharacterized protein n=1 Tax=Triticum urartu TaxID=4572 RepID=A0A8R7QVQ7_TRIUA
MCVATDELVLSSDESLRAGSGKATSLLQQIMKEGAPVAPVPLTSPAKSSGTSSLTNAGEISWTTSISSKLGKISIYIIILIFFIVREWQMHE